MNMHHYVRHNDILFIEISLTQCHLYVMFMSYNHNDVMCDNNGFDNICIPCFALWHFHKCVLPPTPVFIHLFE